MEFHPVANIFPMMNEEEYNALKKDILANGLLQPVYTQKGQIIDGRNRWKACQELGIEPKLKEWDGKGSLVGFVISHNLERRHLTPSQKAAVAVEALPFFEAEAKAKMLEAGERGRETQKNGVVKNFTSPTKEEKKQATQDANAKKAAAQAGKKFKANSSYVSHVKKIKVEAPETFEKIKSGELTVGDAKREVKKRAQAEARREAIASSPEIQVKAWDGTIKPNTVSLCSVFDLELPANSVDMIFTDPPYHDEYLSLYERLAIVADECLKEGGYCLAYAGKMFLPQVLNALSTKLEYVWTFCVWQPDNNSKIAKHHLMEMWRPIVCFKKAGKSNVEWTHDGLQGTRSKSHHEWEQQIEPPMKYIDAYTKAEDLVLEPFVGGGTTLTACQRLGRRFIGFDVDEEAIKTTMLRLKNEQTA